MASSTRNQIARLVPPGFWDAPAIHAALASRHMGRVIAAYRNHPAHGRPLSQTEVASWVGLTQGQLSRIENGPPLADLGKLVQWAKVLTIPANLLWFQLPGQSTPTAPAAPAPSNGPFRLVHVPATTDGDNDLAAMHTFRSADRTLGGGHLYAAVLNYLHTDIGPRMFGGGPDNDDTRGLFISAAGLTEMAGWMAHDAGFDQQADRHFRRALDLAVIGRDHQLHVHVLASRTHLALGRRDPTQARRHATDAETVLARAGRPPALVARVAALQARTHAALGHHREALLMLDRATTGLSAHDTPVSSPWVSHFDDASLASDAARCLRTLGNPREATRHLHRIIELRLEGTRAHAFAKLSLTSILIQQGHPDEACAMATDAVNAIATVNSHVITSQLHQLGAQLEPYRSSAAVREFADKLSHVIGERTSMHRSATIR
ncbi:helix-turn-helix domain-containing protein [Nocardia sp. NBC_00508]|uniref:helix-turn-helix domain-containing protein n=1 Tax=Nocardia sp. NBC_00508 TaxID=2975992 RepID=UPI002E810D75|nr:helix-turn-helix domain-containing protein [Nocardia sp. NBC_00508]WUD68682.1 helix-turn-helix domain-containing protein [Nocardia sp. NBC_00508]